MRYVTILVLTTFPMLLISAARAELPSVGPCQQADITLHLDEQKEEDYGMSQGGINLLLHNVGTGACMLSQLPVLNFSDAEHHPVTAERRTVWGMHPGPVLPSVIVPADGELQILLSWEASDAFDVGNCIWPAFVSVELDGGSLTIPFDRRMCAAKGQTSYYLQSMIDMP